MARKFIIGSLILISFLGGTAVMLNQISRNSTPAKGYKITIHEVTYTVNQYFIEDEYLIFSDEYGRQIEVHKNFATVSEVR